MNKTEQRTRPAGYDVGWKASMEAGCDDANPARCFRSSQPMRLASGLAMRCAGRAARESPLILPKKRYKSYYEIGQT